jgi:hypothetical protein
VGSLCPSQRPLELHPSCLLYTLPFPPSYKHWTPYLREHLLPPPAAWSVKGPVCLWPRLTIPDVDCLGQARPLGPSHLGLGGTPKARRTSQRVAVETLGLSVASSPEFRESGFGSRCLSCTSWNRFVLVRAPAPACSWRLSSASRTSECGQ